MSMRLIWLILGLVVGVLSGCAVTTPSDQDVVLVRALVAEQPDVPIAQLSREMGISQSAVVAALPEDMRREIGKEQLRQLFNEMHEWGKVQFKMRHGNDVIYYEAEGVGSGMPRPEELHIIHDGLSMFIRPDDLGQVWLIDKPGRGGPERGLILCDSDGRIRFAFMLLYKTSPVFDQAWERFEKE